MTDIQTYQLVSILHATSNTFVADERVNDK